MKNRAEIKREARQLLRSGKPSPILAGAVLMLVSQLFSLLSSFFTLPSAVSPDMLLELYTNAIAVGDIDAAMSILQSALPQFSALGLFLNVLGGLVIAVLTAGFYLFCMKLRRGQQTTLHTMLDGFGKAGQVIWCQILLSVKVALWSLLFVVPGIIAAYRYRFAIYNLMSEDDLTAGQAIRLSCRQTQGMKGDLFLLDLSFLGWAILSSLTWGILNLWLTPYMVMADLAYFEEAQLRMGRTIPSGNVPPQSEDPWDR